MSISLVGIMVGLPLALAMRTIMGKEKFEQWLEESDYILYTNFSSMEEMQKTVQKAGYDVTQWGDSLKTHLTEKKSSYFLWEKRNTKIAANMSIYDDKEAIKTFVKKVEAAAGRTMFYEESKSIESKKTSVSVKKEAAVNTKEYSETFPSVYVDADLILKILGQYQISVLSAQENRIESKYECYKMTFTRNSGEEPFDIHISSDSNKMKALYDCLDCLTEEYYASVQEKTYLHIREQLEEEGLTIEEEQVQEDNSIVLTVLV